MASQTCLAYLTEGGKAKRYCLDQMAIFEDIDQVLTEGSAPGHMHNGHAVLEGKEATVAQAMFDSPCSHPTLGHMRRTGTHPGRIREGHFRQVHGHVLLPATTRVPAAVKKASNPEPLLVKKLGASKLVMPVPSCSLWPWIPSPWRLPTCTVVSAGGAGWELR